MKVISEFEKSNLDRRWGSGENGKRVIRRAKIDDYYSVAMR